MKFIKILLTVTCATALLTLPSFAGEKTEKKTEATKKTCCETARADDKECTHKCCVAAHKEGKSCTHCNPNKEDLKKTAKKADKTAEKGTEKAASK
jgi:hypothetical protein